MQRFGEVEFTAHGGISDRGDRVQRARAGGEHLDDFLLDQRRVDVEHDEPFGAPRDAVVLQRHVDADVGGHPRQHLLQLPADPGRHGHPQFQAGDRIVRDAADEVDVDAQGGHLMGNPAERFGSDRPAQHHDRVRRRVPDDRQIVAALDSDVQADAMDRRFDLVA